MRKSTLLAAPVAVAAVAALAGCGPSHHPKVSASASAVASADAAKEQKLIDSCLTKSNGRHQGRTAGVLQVLGRRHDRRRIPGMRREAARQHHPADQGRAEQVGPADRAELRGVLMAGQSERPENSIFGMTEAPVPDSGSVTGFVTGQVAKVKRPLIALFTILPGLLVLAAAVGILGAAKVIPASQATSLSLFSGKAATAADTAIVKQVTDCGKTTGTITAVTWTPRRCGHRRHPGPALRAPGATVSSLSSCLAGANLANGPTAQNCGAVAQTSGGATADKALAVRPGVHVLHDDGRCIMTATNQDLKLAPLTHFQRVWQLVIGGAVSFGAGGFIYGLYFLIFDAVYRIGGSTWTLSNVWNNWPTNANLPQALSGIRLGGQGGLGTWFVSQWPDIQHVFLQDVPAGLLAGAFVGLALNRGAGKKIGWFDKLTLKVHDVVGVIPSRLQSEATTPAQYIFLGPLMILFALPGVFLFSVLDLGGLALMHHYGFHGLDILGSTAVEIAGMGFFGHQFFANKASMRPAEDAQEFFEDRALGKAQGAIDAVKGYARGQLPLLDCIEQGTAAGKRVKLPWFYPPNYSRILTAKLELLANGTLTFKERSGAARYVLPGLLFVGFLVTILGLYCKFWLANHGGLYV